MNSKRTKISHFFARRVIELTGLFFMGVGIFALLAFISFDPMDPSLNKAGDGVAVVKNWMGTFGAHFAQPGIEFAGATCFAISMIFIFWGWNIAKKSFKWSRLWLRVLATAIAIPSLSAMFSLVDQFEILPEAWPRGALGGYIGTYLRDKLVPIITIWGYGAAAIAIAISSYYVATGLHKQEWLQILKLFTGTIGFFVKGFQAFARTFKQTFAGALEEHDTNEKPEKPAKASKTAYKRTTKEKTEKPEKPKKREKPAPVETKAALKTKRKIVDKTIKKQTSEASQTSLDLEMRENYQPPALNLLKSPPKKNTQTLSESALENNAEMLESVLQDFGIQGDIIEVRPGPVVTQYALEPAAGTKSSRVIGLADDIARSMSAISARIAVVAGQNAIGIELPNSNRQTVYLREMLEDAEYKKHKGKLPIILGKDIGGDPIVIDLAKTPHMLVAGTTGSGKSVGVNAIIMSLLYRFSPDECKFIMIDPKMLELSMYHDIPHLLTPVVTEPSKAVVALKWTVKEMEQRYRLMSTLGVRNVEGYNKKLAEARQQGKVLERSVQTGFDPDTGKPTYEDVPIDMSPMPFIVVIVDEMADLMLVAGKEIELSIQRLAQMARAAGIHIILATQRPSVDVITGVIKANFPTRLSFQVTSKIDSRTVLGEQGAEQLLGMGDMLYMAGGSRITRVHGPFVDDKEVERVVSYLKKQGTPNYIDEVTIDDSEEGGTDGIGASGERDELFDKAVEVVIQNGKASTSFVQRQLKIGYNRAANIIDQMEQEGIISEADHVGRREILGR